MVVYVLIFMTKNGYFYDKKISKENLRVDYYFLLKFARGNVPCFPLPEPYHLRILILKCRSLNVVWTKIVTKKRIEEFNFFNWLSVVKNLVLSNDGSKLVPIVIQWHENKVFIKNEKKIAQWLGLCRPSEAIGVLKQNLGYILNKGHGF